MNEYRTFLCVGAKKLYWRLFLYTFQQNYLIYTLLYTFRPIKFVGHITEASISDRKSLDKLEKRLITGWGIIDKSFFNETQKLWSLQHVPIPRIQWTLIIYEVPISHAIKLE